LKHTTSNTPPLSPELARKAELLKAAPLFVDRGGGYHQKQILFLVLAGAKPVGEAVSGHMVRVGDRGHSVADDPKLVGEFLTSIGLEYDLSSFDGRATDALVSLDRRLLRQYQAAEEGDYATAGRLFGYPDSAVTAFAAGLDRLLSQNNQARYATEAGIDPAVLMYRLSQENWAEELKVAARWQQLLRLADLLPADSVAAA
jgi:hypothetical protein